MKTLFCSVLSPQRGGSAKKYVSPEIRMTWPQLFISVAIGNVLGIILITALLFGIAFYSKGASAAEKPDFSDIEALPLMRDGTCSTQEVPQEHRCTLYCANDECTQAYLIMWEGNEEAHLFSRNKDGKDGVLIWSKGFMKKTHDSSMSSDALMDALQEHGTIVLRKECTDPKGNAGFTCVFIELGEDRYVLAFDKQGAAFLFLETEGNAENTLLWRRGLAI